MTTIDDYLIPAALDVQILFGCTDIVCRRWVVDYLRVGRPDLFSLWYRYLTLHISRISKTAKK